MMTCIYTSSTLSITVQLQCLSNTCCGGVLNNTPAVTQQTGLKRCHSQHVKTDLFIIMNIMTVLGRMSSTADVFSIGCMNAAVSCHVGAVLLNCKNNRHLLDRQTHSNLSTPKMFAESEQNAKSHKYLSMPKCLYLLVEN